MDKPRSAAPLPASDPLYGAPTLTRDTEPVPTGLTPGESREFPEAPGYEILGILGRGGMGVVYWARQLKANRLVALKMIRAVEHATAHDRLRFQIETEAVARLQHANIVQLYEVGEVRGQPFFSLEFCDGGSLAEQLKKQLPSPREAAELIETLARAMHYAHLRGVVHRDLKPGNVLLASPVASTPGGSSRGADATPVAKITDFGLAKRIDEEARDISTSGAILGTASYMAPEQAAGKVHDTGPATDVYALGALLYHCLTGRPPFEGPPHVVLHRVLSEEPVRPSRLAPKAPRDLETICLKCLNKEPARRYASAAELADDLRRFQAGESVQARPAGGGERFWRWCLRNPALAGVGGLAAAAMAAAILVSISFAIYQGDAAAELRREKTQTEFALGQARKQTEKAEQQAQEAKRQAAEARRQSALQMLERGLSLCEQHEEARGMLWLARSLKEVPEDNFLLQRSIRWQLSLWKTRLCPMRAVLSHKGGAIRDAAFSTDGRIVVTAGEDGAAQQWEAATGKRLGVPLAHQAIVEAVAFRPDGRTFVTASVKRAWLWEMRTGKPAGPPQLLADDNFRDAGRRALSGQNLARRRVAFSPDCEIIAKASGKVAQLWALAGGKRLGALLQHQAVVKNVAFSPDGRTLVTLSDTARLWEVPTGRPLSPPLRPPGPGAGVANVAAFSRDGRLLVTGDNAGRLWEAATGKPVGSPLQMPRGPGMRRVRVTAVAFSADGRLVATGSADNFAQVWETATGKPVGPLLRHADRSEVAMQAVTFSPDGRILATAAGRMVCLWSPTTGQPVAPPLQLPHGVVGVAFSPDGGTLLTISMDRAVRLWEAPTTRPLRHLLTPSSAAAVAFSPDGKTLGTGGGDASARLWEVATGKLLLPPLMHQDPVHALAFSPDGRILVAGLTRGANRKNQAAQRWEVATGKPLGPPLQPPDVGQENVAWTPVAFSPDGRLVATGNDKTGRLWEAQSGKLLGPPLPHRRPVRAVAFSPDSRLVLTGSYDGTARLWEARGGKPFGPPLRHRAAVWAAAFSPDGRLVATASDDRTAQLWDVATGQPSGPPLRHQNMLRAVAFSPDGHTLVTASIDHTARLWEVATGQPLGPPLRHQAAVWAAAFSPKPGLVATTSFDHTARLWDVATGQPLGPPLRHNGQVLAVAFSPDGRTLATGGHDASRLWEVPPPMPGQANDIALWLAVASGLEMDEHGTVRELDSATWEVRRRQLQPLASLFLEGAAKKVR